MGLIEGDFYDYNGVLFCHGRVSGTQPDICTSLVMTIDDEYEYAVELDTEEPFRGIFNINTYDHARTNSPKTLSSGVHKVYLEFYNGGNDFIIGDYLCVSGTKERLDYKMHNSLWSPSLSYDADKKTITVTNEGRGRYFLEIRRRNRNKVNTSYTETEKDYLFTTLYRGTEGGKYYEGSPFTSLYDLELKDTSGNLYEPIPKLRYQWMTKIPTIILFDSDADFTEAEKAEYYSLACEALDDLSAVTRKTFTLRNKATRKGNTDFFTCVNNDWDTYYKDDANQYRMIIRFGIDDTMKLGGQGRWTVSLHAIPTMGVTVSYPSIAVDKSAVNESIKHVVYEEIMQSIGMGNDSHSQKTSLHWDPHWSNPESYSGIDKTILEMVCSVDVCGWTSFDLINKLDTPCLLYQDYTGEDLVFDVSQLNENEEYYAWAWIAREGTGGGIVGGSSQNSGHVSVGGTAAVADGWDDCPYSMRTQIEFDTVPIYPHPGKFYWTHAKEKGEGFNLTADEWNGLQEHIKKMLLHRLGGDTKGYEPDEVSEGATFYASKYNEAGDAIKLINGYGTWIPVVLPGQEITADSGSDVAKENVINAIVNELNAIPAK